MDWRAFVLTPSDVMFSFPFEDPVVVVKVTGKALREALENGLNKYEEKDGKFHALDLRLAGIMFYETDL